MPRSAAARPKVQFVGERQERPELTEVDLGSTFHARSLSIRPNEY